MKEEIIDTAGKIWQFLGRNGEVDVSVLAKRLKEKKKMMR